MVQKLEQETMEKEMTIVVLREEAVACHESERHAEAEHSKNIASMQTEISDLRESIRERDEKLRLLQESQLLSSDELSNAIKSLENDLNGKREELQFSQAENMSLHEIIRTMESTEASQAAQLVAASQKAVLAETSLAERDSLIKIAEERIARLEGMLNESNQVSDTRMNKCKAEIAVLREQIQEMERQHAFEAAELNAEYRQEVAELQDALQRAKETIEQQKAIAIAHEQTASTLRAELERKEQARVRLAQLKAANTPPDFGALQAKMQAVSGRSATKSLNNSLGSSTGSQTGGAIGDSDAAVLTTLKAEVQASKSQLAAAKDVISSKDQCIQKLEQRVLDLESNIAAYRRVSCGHQLRIGATSL